MLRASTFRILFRRLWWVSWGEALADRVFYFEMLTADS